MTEKIEDLIASINMTQVLVAILEEHKNTKFTFKCHTCHINEGNIEIEV